MTAGQQSGVLAGQKVLVVEDEYFLADEIRRALLKHGASVVGPFGEVSAGLAAASSDLDLTRAVLDIHLRGEVVFPIAEALRQRSVPFVFTTGYDQSALPEPFQAVPRCEKPINVTALIRALANE